MPRAAILSQGDEVVTGQIVDSNAAHLATRLTDLGFDVIEHRTVGDRPDDIVLALRELSVRVDVCVGTGGLGPTEDDHTAAACAAAFDRPLVFDPIAMAAIEAMFQRYSRPMPASNRKQAMLPTGAVRLDNDWGTAPGFALEAGGGWFAFVPGVPREMKPMFEERVRPLLSQRFALRPGRLVTLRTVGIGESDMQARAGRVDHPGVVMGTRTTLPENHLKLRFSADVPDADVRALVAEVAARIGTPVFAIDGLDGPQGSLAEVIGRALTSRGESLAVAESCTGGRVAAMCTAVPGSSRWFHEGVIAYANDAKVRHLGVPTDLLASVGAVSPEVACAMAEGLRARSGSTWSIATTGIAGPDGGSPEKPVGTVFLAVSGPSGTTHRHLKSGGERSRIQDLAAASALDLLRRQLDPVPASGLRDPKESP